MDWRKTIIESYDEIVTPNEYASISQVELRSNEWGGSSGSRASVY